MIARLLHRVTFVVVGTVLVTVPPAHGGDALPPAPAPGLLAAEVDAALGSEPDATIQALDVLAKAADQNDPSAAIVAATAVTVLSRARWASAPRGLDVRLKAIEVLGHCGFGAISAVAVLEHAAKAAGADPKVPIAADEALTRIRKAVTAAEAVIKRRMKIAKSTDNVRSMLLYFLGSGAGIERAWPAYGGKRFVLWLVATQKINRSDERQLAILFSPGDGTRSLATAGGIKGYETMTLATLKDPAIDVGALTSYAGRRNDEREHVVTAADMASDAPVIADLSFPGGVILGYTSGAARWVTAEELGLPPDKPIVVGDSSPVEMLRHFSDR